MSNELKTLTFEISVAGKTKHTSSPVEKHKYKIIRSLLLKEEYIIYPCGRDYFDKIIKQIKERQN